MTMYLKWHEKINLKHKYETMTMKELYKGISLLTLYQLSELTEVLTSFSECFDEIPLRILPITELQDYLEINWFDEEEAKEVMKESKQYNYTGYFNFNYSDGWTFYNDLQEWSKTLIDNFNVFIHSLKDCINLLEIYELLHKYEIDNNYRNYITFGNSWKKQCNYTPFRKVLRNS